MALFADFHRKHQEAAIVEAERNQRVCDGRAGPVREQHIDRAQLIEVILS